MRSVLAPVLAVVASGLFARVEAQATEYTVNIERQSLVSALQVLSQQTGIQVVSIIDRADHVKMIVGPLTGALTVDAALTRLLAHTGLTFSRVNEKTVAIVQARNKSVPMSSHITGAREFTLLRVQQSAPMTSGSGSYMSSDPRSSGSRSPMGESEEVIVTGSRLGQGEHGAAPIVSIDQQRIKQLGVTTVAAVLDHLPQQAFSFGEGNSPSGSREIRLRGLGAGTTLVLINGRRAVPSALLGAFNSFDLNTIPLSMVERIEVLSDSASAIYGADAIGGVVNIILENELDHPTVDLYYGGADGGAEERRASVAAGIEGERFRASGTLDVYEREFLLGSERDLSRNEDYTRFGSIDARSRSANPGNVSSVSTASLPGVGARTAAVPAGSSGVGLTPASFIATAGQTNLVSLGQYRSIVPAQEHVAGAFNAEFDLTDSTVLFAEAMYVDRKNTSQRSPVTLSNRRVPATNAYNPFGVPVNVSFLIEGTGPRLDISEAEALRAAVGGRGKLGTWDWDVSALRSDETGATHTENNLDAARLTAALAASDPAQALNPFQDGPGGSQALLDSLLDRNPNVNDFASEAWQSVAFVRGSLFELPTGSADIVLGGEWRTEELEMEFASGPVPLKDRRTSSAFTELRVPLLGQSITAPLVRRLSLSLAGRYDRYNDFGDTFNPQLALDWSVNSALSMRASWGSSFRPPSLYELYNPATQFDTFIVDPGRNDELAPVTIVSGGNPELEPEEARSVTFGAEFAPQTPLNLRTHATFWRIHQDDRVQALLGTSLLANEDIFSDRVVRGASDGSGLPGPLVRMDLTSLNYGSVKTSGIDVGMNCTIRTGFGSLTPILSATWVGEYEAADTPRTPAYERVGVANTSGTIPRWRAAGTLAWEREAVQMSITGRYIGSYGDTAINVPNGRRVSPGALMDIQGSLDLASIMPASGLLSAMTARIGVNNVFDDGPDFAEVFGLGYDVSQDSLRQRFIYASLTTEF